MNLNDHALTENNLVNILVVDDQEKNLFAITELLSNPEYKIIKAKTGREAMRYLLEKEFALILMDVQMPEIDGFETAALIREHEKFRHTPIIFITGIEKEIKNIEKGYSLGAVDYLVKPVVPEFLKAKVSVFVELFIKKRKEIEARQRIIDLFQTNNKLVESNRELEQFAAIASHDLKEPLRMINSFSELLEKKYLEKLDEKGAKHLSFIKKSSERMLNMIESIMRYSGIHKGGLKFEKVDFNNLIKDFMNSSELKIAESKTEISFENLPVLSVDLIQITRVFQNLIFNSIKFRGKETPLIKIKADPFIDEYSEEKKWLFSIKDNGMGISSKHIDKIFIAFKRLHSSSEYPGSGIGLAECKKIIEGHKGKIWVESQGEGNGATFYFTIPTNLETDNLQKLN